MNLDREECAKVADRYAYMFNLDPEYVVIDHARNKIEVRADLLQRLLDRAGAA